MKKTKATGKRRATKPKSTRTLKDLDVRGVRGGSVKGGKAKTADKAFSSMDAYIKG